MTIEQIIYITTSLFVIMDPPGALPLMIKISEGLSRKSLIRVSFEVAAFVFILISLFAVAGKYILDYFGISIYSLKIAGGLMLAILGFEMMKEGEKPRAKREISISEEEALQNAIVPLGSPMLAGPGTLSLAIIYSSIYSPWLVIIGALINSIILIPIISFSGYISKIIGERGVRVFTRILGFFILALSVQYILDGVLIYVSTLK